MIRTTTWFRVVLRDRQGRGPKLGVRGEGNRGLATIFFSSRRKARRFLTVLDMARFYAIAPIGRLDLAQHLRELFLRGVSLVAVDPSGPDVTATSLPRLVAQLETGPERQPA